MHAYRIGQNRVIARIRAAIAQSTPRHDPLPYGLVFDVDAVSGVMIRPAARPALPDFAPLFCGSSGRSKRGERDDQ
jgi:hypothetical protein